MLIPNGREVNLNCLLKLHSEIFPGPGMNWDLEVGVFQIQTVYQTTFLEGRQNFLWCVQLEFWDFDIVVDEVLV